MFAGVLDAPLLMVLPYFNDTQYSLVAEKWKALK